MNGHLTNNHSGWILLFDIESKQATQFTNLIQRNGYLLTNLCLLAPGNIQPLTKENPFHFCAVEQGFRPPQAFFEVSQGDQQGDALIRI